jgi:hypothetical protein
LLDRSDESGDVPDGPAPTGLLNGVAIKACLKCYDRWDGTSDCTTCGGRGYVEIGSIQSDGSSKP